MKRVLFQKELLILLLLAVSFVASAKTIYNKGTVTIYVGQEQTFYHNLSSTVSVSASGWFLRQTTGNSWSDSQEDWCYKIVSKNSQSCTVKGLADNSKSSSKYELHFLSEYETYECYWTIIVKSRGTVTVTANPSGGTVDAGTKVYLSASVSGAKIYYTTNGSIPNENSSLYDSSGITINQAMTLKAIAYVSGYESEVSTWKYTIKSPEGVVLWCEGNNTLYFLSTTSDIIIGDTFNGQSVTKVWKWSDISPYDSDPWRYTVKDKMEKAVFEPSFSMVRPTNCDDWFLDCSKLEQIEGIENLNTSMVTSMYRMFMASGLKSLDLSSFDTRNVTNMVMMFESCEELENLNLKNFNTSLISGTKMQDMFRSCKKIKHLDLSSFDTHNVTKMSHMFYECRALESVDLSSFDTRNVTNMESMFQSCTSLKELHLGNFNTSNVTNMRAMFYWCPQLSEIDVSSFNVSNLTSLRQMFVYCESLTSLDLSSFDTKNITIMDEFLYGCTNLKTVYVGGDWSTSNVASSKDMFSGCINIVGGNGTHYDSQHQDATYAHIDGGTSYPGYFTDKNGSDISMFEMDYVEGEKATFSLYGQRLTAPRKGINIVGGKKVIVK